MTVTNTLKEALYTIKMLKKELSEKISQPSMPIAIIGIGCRIPSAHTKDAFWEMLLNSRNVISNLPEDRLELLAGSIEAKNANFAKGGFLSSIDSFDPYFFGISPREAMLMDPQQRLLLEVTYEALEDAGISVDAVAGSNTGVFASLYASQLTALLKKEREEDALFISTGNATSIAANRLSYFFDLHGPSIVFDTACSSSLIALHTACMYLQNSSCELAIVGGVNINLLPSTYLLLTNAKMLAPDGQCKTFDAAANGYVPGEGAGVVILKPLARALDDKDRIYATLIGSDVSQDGKKNGLSAPNGLQQEKLIKRIYQKAMINPNQVAYVECHGTGTFLGDPIEVQALGEVISDKRQDNNPCWIGSLKTNIGHLEPAAGIMSVIKVALSLQQGVIPPHLNFENPNPHIEFAKYQFKIPQEPLSWPMYSTQRIAGVSAFGFGGTIAHVVLENCLNKEENIIEDAPQLFILSAKNTSALNELIKKWYVFLDKNKKISLTRICYNLKVRRSHYFCRIAIIVNSIEDLLLALRKIITYDLESIPKLENILINISPATIQQSAESDLEKEALFFINREEIDWKLLYRGKTYQHLDMPLYPWQNQSYWPDIEKDLSVTISYPFSKKQLISPLLQFEFVFDSSVLPELQDTYYFLHMGFYLEMLTYISHKYFQQRFLTIHEIKFILPITIPQHALLKIHIILEKQNDKFTFKFYSLLADGQWLLHTTGALSLDKSSKLNDVIDLSCVKSKCSLQGSKNDFMNRILSMNMPAEGTLQWTQQYWLNEWEIICELTSPVPLEKHASFDLNIHPGIVDAAIQSLFMLLPDKLLKPYIATQVNSLYIETIATNLPLYIYSRLNVININQKEFIGDIFLIDLQGRIIFSFENIVMTQLNENLNLENITKNKSQKIDLASISYEERSRQVSEFLVNKISSLFSMPKEDITHDRSLLAMGMDSLMAVALIQAIDNKFDSSIALKDLLSGMSITDIVNKLLIVSQEISNPWISHRQKISPPSLRLFCFPYGGAGASIYTKWQARLSNDTIDVCPIQYPGREERINEKSFSDIDALVLALCENLQNTLDIPYIFFGHSMGALIAFELTRLLRMRKLPLPKCLIISAFPDPSSPIKKINELVKELHTEDVSLDKITINKMMNIFQKNGLLPTNLKFIDNMEINKILLPIFMSDINIVKNYKYKEQLPLDIPIKFFMGKQDPWIQYEDYLGWCTQTTKTCELYEFNSEHLFIQDEKISNELFSVITNILHDLITT